MFRQRMLKQIISSVKRCSVVVIYGAGVAGREAYDLISSIDGSMVKCFFDSDNGKIGQYLCGVYVTKPVYLEKCLIVIANHNYANRIKQKQVLLKLGYLESDIVEYHHDLDWEYWHNLSENEYKGELSLLFRESFGRNINWEKPRTYNEILTWEKLNATDLAIKQRLGDKLLVRDYVKARIGEIYLTNLIGEWDSPEQIDFDSLPKSFVLKVSTGSGRNIIVKDKNKISKEDVCKQLEEWQRTTYRYYALALHYSNEKPRILCEEFLEGLAETEFDYDVYCFHGEPKYILRIDGAHKDEGKSSFYDTNWSKLPCSYGYAKDTVTGNRPSELDMILDLSRKLSKDFRHVRVDWYILSGGKVLFSELTFSSWGGLARFEPESFDELFGRAILEGDA